jgi:hypothetical protein
VSATAKQCFPYVNLSVGPDCTAYPAPPGPPQDFSLLPSSLHPSPSYNALAYLQSACHSRSHKIGSGSAGVLIGNTKHTFLKSSLEITPFSLQNRPPTSASGPPVTLAPTRHRKLAWSIRAPHSKYTPSVNSASVTPSFLSTSSLQPPPQRTPPIQHHVLHEWNYRLAVQMQAGVVWRAVLGVGQNRDLTWQQFQ